MTTGRLPAGSRGYPAIISMRTLGHEAGNKHFWEKATIAGLLPRTKTVLEEPCALRFVNVTKTLARPLLILDRAEDKDDTGST